MTRKPTKTTDPEADAGAVAVAVAVEPAALDLIQEDGTDDDTDDGAVEAEDVEPDQETGADGSAAQTDGETTDPDPEAEPIPEIVASADPGAADPQSADLVAEPEAEQLQRLADLITDMTAWRLDELMERLLLGGGLKITRSIEGTRVELSGIICEVADLGPNGARRALDNWANAARRKVLEMGVVSNA